VYADQIRRVKDDNDFALVLCGNKVDLEPERKVTAAEGTELAEKWGCPFFEASAKQRTNVEEAFFALVRAIRKIRNNTFVPTTPKKRCVVM
jgi:GTPase KRas protein